MSARTSPMVAWTYGQALAYIFRTPRTKEDALSFFGPEDREIASTAIDEMLSDGTLIRRGDLLVLAS